MEVIKAVNEKDGKLVSTFAWGKWQKEYVEGVETKPDVGHLFAFSKRNLKEARRSMGNSKLTHYWIAEAEIVGRVRHSDISMQSGRWRSFWKGLKLQLRRKGADYLLCSSITLIREIAL